MTELAPLRVLVVDDDPRFGVAVTALLEAAGMTVIGQAEDGAAALLLVKTLQPDVVTMDIDMPRMDGVEATKRLRIEHPELPVVFVTGSESSERVQEALALGQVNYVKKTDAYHALPQAIRRLTNHRQ